MNILLQFGPKLVFLLGFTNLASLFLVLLSCRCMMGIKLFVNLMRYSLYKKFYSYHCYYWWVFIISVAIHTLFAFFSFGNPF